MTGRIIKALSGFYYVSSDSKIYECKARGSFRKSGVSPLVGDSVTFEINDDKHGIVEEVLERKNFLTRPPISNIDKLFIVSSFETPKPNSFIIDKITAIAIYNDIEPIIVFNKSDMGDFSSWEKIYKNSGFKTYVVSALFSNSADVLIPELKDCTSAFCGNSGVGKSSILNSIFKNDEFKTGDVSEKLGRGRHTTRHTELFSLPFGGFVADTPGFSSIEENTEDYNFKENLVYSFPDIEKFSHNCKFTSCTHTCETGCGVINAVKNGELEESRHKSYMQLFEELKDLKPWNSNKQKNK